MNSIQLYRILQQHVGDVNQLVVWLYNGDVSADAAKDAAVQKLQKTLATLLDDK